MADAACCRLGVIPSRMVVGSGDIDAWTKVQPHAVGAACIVLLNMQTRNAKNDSSME